MCPFHIEFPVIYFDADADATFGWFCSFELTEHGFAVGNLYVIWNRNISLKKVPIRFWICASYISSMLKVSEMIRIDEIPFATFHKTLWQLCYWVDSKVTSLKLCDLAFRISFAETVKNVIKENSWMPRPCKWRALVYLLQSVRVFVPRKRLDFI